MKVGARRAIKVVTFSGFTEDNPIRGVGDVNFYVQSREYGFVEVAHLALCHAVLDIDMGWGEQTKAGSSRRASETTGRN